MKQRTHDQDGGYEDRSEQEIAKSLEELDAIEAAMLERIGGPLSEKQKKSLADLLRLDHSLRGPDEVLDQEQYSRPIPPKPHKIAHRN
jgi:hypothetical protein